MKVLEVFGDQDYGAMMYEDAVEHDVVVPEELWEKANKDGHQTYEEGEVIFEYIAHEFGEVDEKFIDFIKNEIADYDYLKHHNFYVV